MTVAFAQSPTPQEYLTLHAAPAVMIAIAQAESGGQQFNSKGNLLCDGITGTHCGIFQIGEIHRKEAEKLGYDIDTERGNIAFALWLYKKNGTRDWYSSYNDPSNPNSWGKLFDKDGRPKI